MGDEFPLDAHVPRRFRELLAGARDGSAGTQQSKNSSTDGVWAVRPGESFAQFRDRVRAAGHVRPPDVVSSRRLDERSPVRAASASACPELLGAKRRAVRRERRAAKAAARAERRLERALPRAAGRSVRDVVEGPPAIPAAVRSGLLRAGARARVVRQ